MRILTLILSIYILGINFVPCSDLAQESVSNDDIENVANTQDHSHSNDTTQDLCSPFCQCHCCHVHVVEILINDFETINNEIFTHQFIHFNNSGKEITKRLLQPPRV